MGVLFGREERTPPVRADCPSHDLAAPWPSEELTNVAALLPVYVVLAFRVGLSGAAIRHASESNTVFDTTWLQIPTGSLDPPSRAKVSRWPVFKLPGWEPGAEPPGRAAAGALFLAPRRR